jgi:outer membrane autotransporter protein
MFASRNDVASDLGNTILALDSMSGKPSTWGFWTRGYGNLGERRGNDVSSRYDYNTGGIIVGFDRKISDTFLLGASVGYSYTRVNMKDLSDNGTVSSYQGSLYGAYLSGPWYVNGILSYGYNRNYTSRDISFGNIMATANADYGGQTIAAYTEAGYAFKMNTITIIPMASFQAGYLTQNSYTERDAGALNLAVDRNHTSSLLSSLGVKVRKDFTIDAGTLTPEVRAKWLHEFSNDDYMLNSAFAGAPASTFTAQGDRPNRDSIGLGFGLTCVTKKNLSLFLTYDAIISGDHTEHGGSLGMRYRW